MVRGELADLLAGAVHWLGENLEFFRPFGPGSGMPPPGRVKAALELAVFCRCWARLAPPSTALDEAMALVRAIWRCPEFPALIAALGDHARPCGLVYAALAPAGTDSALTGAVLAQLVSDGYLSPAGKSVCRQLETRYYAEMAGAAHSIGPYRDLMVRSLLVHQPPPPVTNSDAYTITHTAFYLSDYGYAVPRMRAGHRRRAERLVCSLLDTCVREERWDLAGELVITLACLGTDPVRTTSGVAGIRSLVRAQLPNGAIPGRAAGRRAANSASRGEFFRKAYHTTFVAALMSLIV